MQGRCLDQQMVGTFTSDAARTWQTW